AAARRHAVAAGSWVNRLTVAGPGLAGPGQRIGDLAPGAAAGVDETGGLQPLEGVQVERVARALEDDRRVWPKAEPRQHVDDGCGGAGQFAWRVQIFDAQQPLSVMRERVEPAGE